MYIIQKTKADVFLRKNLAFPGVVSPERILSTVRYSQHILYNALASNRTVILEWLLYNTHQCSWNATGS